MLFAPGTDQYQRSTTPHNASAHQRPAAVAVPDTAQAVADAVGEVARSERQLLAQGTGHGAGGDLGDDVVLLDTSRLRTLQVDRAARTARIGAGLTWGEVNAVAERSGLLGLAGSSPTVGVAGYVFGGGLGWLGRRHGLASSSLLAVEYVDGAGQVRRAAADAADPVDREALFAFRGGGGVGVATALELELFPGGDVTAGYLLWPAEALADVVGAWGAAIASGDVGDGVASSIGLLRLPPAPPFPEELRGRLVVHLAVADPEGTGSAGAAEPLLAAVRAAGATLREEWGAADATALSRIHLDPPDPVPALGDARWLDASAPAVTTALLGLVAQEGSPLAMAEVRHVQTAAPAREGALTAPVSPFVHHAVGAVSSPQSATDLESAFAAGRAAAAPADTGRVLGSWVEGATRTPGALPDAVRARVSEVADAVDPHHVIRRSRFLR